MIDKVLGKIDPTKFLMMLEKLNDALPGPGKAVLKPFFGALKQALEIRSQKMDGIYAQVQSAKAQVQGATDQVQSATSSLVAARNFGQAPDGIELANVNDVKIDVDDEPAQTRLRVTRIIIGYVSVCTRAYTHKTA